MAKGRIKNFIKKIKKDNENGARKNTIEELFYDFNSSRIQVYKMNFVRGIFFGLGSVIGATVLIGVAAGLLSLFTDLPGGIGHFVQNIVDAMNSAKK